MNTPNSAQTLLMYVNDMLALERLIKEAVARQTEDEHIHDHPEAAALINEIAASTEVRLTDLADLSESLGGGVGAVKEAVTAVAGVFAGLYDKVRKHPVSRLLRDDYTALALASTAYSMLYTSGVALHNGQVAAVAQRGMRKVAPLIMEVSRVIPAVVVAELTADFPDANPEAAAAGREATVRAWSPEGELAHG